MYPYIWYAEKGNKPVDVNKNVRVAGQHTYTTWADATDDKGKPMADLEV